MKNIKLIRTAVMLVLVSSVFIFAACAKGDERKLTEKDIVGTWTGFDGEQYGSLYFKSDKTGVTSKGGSLGKWKFGYEKLDKNYAAIVNMSSAGVLSMTEDDYTLKVIIVPENGQLVMYQYMQIFKGKKSVATADMDIFTATFIKQED